MTIENIDSMSIEELKAAQAKVEAALQQAQSAAKSRVLEQVEQWFKLGMLTATDMKRIMGGTAGKKQRKARAPSEKAVAWVDPQDDTNRYTGHGKLPEWLRKRLETAGVANESKARAEWVQANLRKAA